MKNSKLKTIVTACSLLFCSAFSAAEDKASTTSSVWKVTNGDDTVYVGGTVHILPVSEFPLPEAFDIAYKNSDSIVLEAEVPGPADQEFRTKLMQTVTYTDGKKLADVVSPETYAKLDDYFKQFGVGVAQVSQFKPGFLQTMMIGMEAQRVNMAGEGVDAYFAQVAKRQSKPIEYLETIEFQLDMITKLGEGNEDEFMNLNLKDLPKFKQSLQELINAWRAGDVTAIDETIIKKMKQEMPEDYAMMMTNRNLDWIPKIEKLFGDEDTEFVLVGVAHLVGEDSVLKMLQAKGYHVERL